jgi:hypothetical protein
MEHMTDNAELPDNIGVALNEASWWGVNVDGDGRRIGLGFDVLTLPEGPGGSGRGRVTLLLVDVRRFAVSHRFARWDDDNVSAEPCTEEEFPTVLRWFGGAPVYGWEFFDTPDVEWQRWADRLSLDVRWIDGPGSHTIELFQEGRRDDQDRHLDFRAWFDRLEIYDTDLQRIPLDEFVAGGKRWWDGLYAGDQRTATAGIYPLTGQTRDPRP